VSRELSQLFGNISRKQIVEMSRRHGTHSVRVFGSVARGTEVEGSDLDLLVEIEPAP
jgi:predicted nucleotidyltransferase